MNKEDILKMSQQENKEGDEREKEVRLRSYATSVAIGGLICTVLYILESGVFDRDAPMIWIITSGMSASKYILDAIKIKKKSDILLSILLGLCFVIFVVNYILDNIG